MEGYFDTTDGRPRIVLKIKGTQNTKVITAVFDTGHTGSLSLPLLDILAIGAELKGISPVRYANGYEANEYLFSVNVNINGIYKEVKAGLIPNPNITEAIAGVQLFSPFVVLLDFKNRRIALQEEEKLKKSLESKQS